MKKLTSQEMQSVRGGDQICWPDPVFGEICCERTSIDTWVCYLPWGF